MNYLKQIQESTEKAKQAKLTENITKLKEQIEKAASEGRNFISLPAHYLDSDYVYFENLGFSVQKTDSSFISGRMCGEFITIAGMISW